MKLFGRIIRPLYPAVEWVGWVEDESGKKLCSTFSSYSREGVLSQLEIMAVSIRTTGVDHEPDLFAI